MFVGRNTPILGMLAKPGLLGIVSRAIAPDIALTITANAAFAQALRHGFAYSERYDQSS
ncbi:hypothetical protein [Bifidobacterium tibiigranuli]|jgi:hypothetical protein|uniref:hypothetical protein n=1 Tax=Bifidobacterium tibiigranuli TaxID=2172043 RepID=UPI0026EF79AD|nr:hypothetical protein [Bifidobacterium tibiigranuli]MCI1649037.1 hypothetical protein [Bifidobacterium tibiigranuli]MCI1673204.1 hypothetical protein [Bifidobacterium tibiigranuli]MCI1713551.1 hypothetical protein [Bifidobacterium tibiigranuli]MCI1833899.1 hypothetical protein [Bifidobacterium tibiigranuli]MCI2186272.1 hypothetical protein [Bifidobacterium tibiigranuli]